MAFPHLSAPTQLLECVRVCKSLSLSPSISLPYKHRSERVCSNTARKYTISSSSFYSFFFFTPLFLPLPQLLQLLDEVDSTWPSLTVENEEDEEDGSDHGGLELALTRGSSRIERKGARTHTHARTHPRTLKHMRSGLAAEDCAQAVLCLTTFPCTESVVVVQGIMDWQAQGAIHSQPPSPSFKRKRRVG